MENTEIRLTRKEKEVIDYIVAEYVYEEGFSPSVRGMLELMDFVKENTPGQQSCEDYYETYNQQIKDCLTY